MNTINNSNYKSYKFSVKGKQYTVTVVTGASNYILVSQEKSRRVWGSMGLEFKNFSAAIKHYKSPEMKVELLKIELGL